MNSKRILANIATAERLYQHIVTHSLKEGDRLPSERQLAENFGVSRSNIRDTLIMLEIKGAISRKHGSGIYIETTDGYQWKVDSRELKPDNNHLEVLTAIRELVELRMILEQFTFVLVAETISNEQLQSLYDFNKQQYLNLTGDGQHTQPGLDFEQKIFQLSSNKTILHVYQQLNISWKNHLSTIDIVAISPSDRFTDHQKILKAIESKNKNKIISAIKDHHQKTLQNLNLLISLQTTQERNGDSSK